MKTTFQLWDTEDNNLIGSYASEEAALQVVRKGVNIYGADAFRMVALGDESPSNRLHVIAEGMELVRLATGRASAQSSEPQPARKVS
jgi:hypothetical protein